MRTYGQSTLIAMSGKLAICVCINIDKFRMRFMAMQNSGSGPLRIGSRGPGVAAVQSQLNALLMPSPKLVADGVFGMKTSQAVKQFQQRRGLTADGIVGPKTAAARWVNHRARCRVRPARPLQAGHPVSLICRRSMW